MYAKSLYLFISVLSAVTVMCKKKNSISTYIKYIYSVYRQKYNVIFINMLSPEITLDTKNCCVFIS